MKPSRRIIVLSALGLLFVCAAFCGIIVLFAPDEAEPEPVAQLVATTDTDGRAVEPADEDEPATASAVEDQTDQQPAATPTSAPTVRPSRTVAPTAAATATDRPTRTPRPTATRAPPTATSLPTATPLPLPTATPIPLPTATPIPLPTNTAAPPTAAAPSGSETASVTAVIDGDTIEVSVNGVLHRVRYIGIDTPETGEACGSEATAANAALVSGRTVTMVRDRSETDRFGRLLRYVYVGSTFVNGALVSGGWADAVDYPPDTAQSATLHSLMAQGAGRGCDLVAAPLPTEPVRAPDPIPLPPAGNCDPSYPDVCIPPAPPDLDCKDIPYKRFRVLPPDPHNFDGSDKDGIGCES